MSLEPLLTYVNEKSSRRRILDIVTLKGREIVFYVDGDRTRGELPQKIIEMINSKLDRTSNWVPSHWGITGSAEMTSIFSCSEASFKKWLGKGTVVGCVPSSQMVTTGHAAATVLLELPDLPLVYPGVLGDIQVGLVYLDEEDQVLVVSNQVETLPGQEARSESAKRVERERCLQLVEARCRRLHQVIKNYPPNHPSHSGVALAIENLRVVERWISGGKTATQTRSMNPGGET